MKREKKRNDLVSSAISIVILLAVGLVFQKADAQLLNRSQVSAQKEQSNIGAKYSYPKTASGKFSGSYTNENVRAVNADAIDIGFIKKLTLFGKTNEYGTKINWKFNSEGDVTYKYEIPYKVDFEFPFEVAPGSNFYLRPVFDFGNKAGQPSLIASQNYTYSQQTTVWGDIPDGRPAFVTSFSQNKNNASLSLNLPTFPGLDAAKGSFNCSVWPCNQGGGNFGNSYAKLGGSGSLNNKGYYSYGISQNTISIFAEGVSSIAWEQAYDYYNFIGMVCGLIPQGVTIAASKTIEYLQKIGGLRLGADFKGKINRRDVVHVQVVGIDPVKVPPDIKGGVWHFENLPVVLRYKVKYESVFTYPLELSVTFKMKGIKTKTLYDKTSMNVYAGVSSTSWMDGLSEFRINGSVRTKQSRVQQTQKLSESRQIAALKPVKLPPLEPEQRIAKKADLKKHILQSETKSFGKPSLPQKNQYTVVLGRYSEPESKRIFNDMKRKRMPVILIPLKNTTDKVISFGSFAGSDDAEELSALIKEFFNIETSITVNPYDMKDSGGRKNIIPMRKLH